MRSAVRDRLYAVQRRKEGGFRKVDIRSGNKDLKAQARKGYYAIKHRDSLSCAVCVAGK